MSGDEERLLSLFRSADNRGKEFILVIAEAEAKHAAEGLYTPHSDVLEAQAGNLPLKGERGKNEG